MNVSYTSRCLANDDTLLSNLFCIILCNKSVKTCFHFNVSHCQGDRVTVACEVSTTLKDGGIRGRDAVSLTRMFIYAFDRNVVPLFDQTGLENCYQVFDEKCDKT